MKNRKAKMMTLAGVVASIIAFYFVFKGIHIETFFNVIKNIKMVPFVLMIFVYLGSFVFRGLRSKIMLRPFKHISWLKATSFIIIGAAANAIFPARLGEVFRAYFTGKKEGVSKSAILGSIAIEHIFDGLILLAILSITAIFADFSSEYKDIIRRVGITGGVFFFIAFAIVLFARLRANFIKRVIAKIISPISSEKIKIRIETFTDNLISSTVFLKIDKTLVSFIFFSIAIWIIEGLMFVLALRALNLPLNWLLAFSAVSFTSLGLAVPSAPAYVGVFQGLILMVFSFFGWRAEDALAYSIINNVVMVVPVIIFGLILLNFYKESIWKLAGNETNGTKRGYATTGKAISFIKKKWVHLVFIASAIILLWPFLFNHQIILQKWASDEGYSFNAYFAKHFGDHLPLWFESYNNGYPAYLNQSGGFLHPVIVLLFKITDYFTAYYFLMLFSISVSFIATYILARNLKMSLQAGIISSFAFTFSQVSVYAHTVTGMGTMLSFIPVLFLCALKIDQTRYGRLVEYRYCLINFLFARRKKMWLILLSGTFLGFGWIAAYVEGIFLAVIACFMFALFLDINFYRAHKKHIYLLDSFKTSWAMVKVIILSGIIASPWLLPVMNFIKETGRGISISVGWEQFLSLTRADINLMRIVHLFYPYISIPYSDGISQIATGAINDFTYVGILPLFFGALVFFNYKQNKLSLFFILLFSFTLLTWLPYVPLNWLIHKLPIFSLFEGYWKWIYVMIFSWAMLAGFGFDLVENLYQTKKFRFIRKGFEFILAGIVILAVVVNTAFWFFKGSIVKFAQNFFATNFSDDIGIKSAIGNVDSSYVNHIISQAIDAVGWNISFFNSRFLLAMIFIFISLVWLFLLGKNKISCGKFKSFSVILIVFNLAFLWYGGYTKIPTSAVAEPPNTVKFLKSDAEQYRAIGFPMFARYRLDWGIDAMDIISRFNVNINLLIPQTNVNLFYDIDSIMGVENYRPTRNLRMSTYTIGGITAETYTKLGNEGSGYEMSAEERISNFNSPFSRNLLSMMNVKYVITALKLTEPWKLVFESIETVHKIKIYVYENPNVLPRIYFARHVKIVPKNVEAAFEELKKIKNFKQTSLIECDNPLCYLAVPKNVSEEDRIVVEKRDFDYLKLKTTTKTPRWLIYSQSNLPTWEVRVDGNLTNIHTANYIYQGVYVPQGEHEVEFRYPGFIGQFYYAFKNLINDPDILLKYLDRTK